MVKWNTPQTGPITFEVLVSDLVALLESLSPGPFVLVCASMGCSESILAYNRSPFIRTHCRGLVWIGPNMPFSSSCPESPGSPPLEVWHGLRAGLRGKYAKQFVAEQIPAVFRADLNPLDKRVLEFFEGLVAQAEPLAVDRMITVMRKPVADDLRKFVEMCEKDGVRVPVMILHSDSDVGMPLEVSAMKVKELVPWADLKVYEKAGHGK
jgi:non-heme chloroperoxidase